MTQGAAETFKKPVIYVTDADYDVLSRLSDAGAALLRALCFWRTNWIEP